MRRYPHRTAQGLRVEGIEDSRGHPEFARPAGSLYGPFSTNLFACQQGNEKALVLALTEMYVEGVSTRKVKQITEELCGTSFFKTS